MENETNHEMKYLAFILIISLASCGITTQRDADRADFYNMSDSCSVTYVKCMEMMIADKKDSTLYYVAKYDAFYSLENYYYNKLYHNK